MINVGILDGFIMDVETAEVVGKIGVDKEIILNGVKYKMREDGLYETNDYFEVSFADWSSDFLGMGLFCVAKRVSKWIIFPAIVGIRSLNINAAKDVVKDKDDSWSIYL